MSIRVIIIDDEEPARDLIRNYLDGRDNIEIVAECADGFSGLKAIQELKPDIIFLDIQMPKLTGFEMLELVEDPPVVVFVTAYDHYAIKAFEMNASDYLLKPYTKARFEAALEKSVPKIAERETDKVRIRQVLESAGDRTEHLQRIAVKSGQKIHVVAVDDITHIGAEGDYVMIYTKDVRYLKEKTMKYMESHLDPDQFVRIHRATIVNVNHISKVELYEKESYSVILKNNVSVKASSSGYKLLKQVLKL
jgi:two-component system, LytTR family, response regulator